MAHFHVVTLDGVCTRGMDGRLSFRRVVPSTADVEHLVGEIADACEARLDGRAISCPSAGAPDAAARPADLRV